jgi:hypothetical protein
MDYGIASRLMFLYCTRSCGWVEVKVEDGSCNLPVRLSQLVLANPEAAF